MSEGDKRTTKTPAPGPWVRRWLSRERHAAWLRAADNDERAALELYEWNARLSAATFRDLSHVEVGLRNAYDRALTVSLQSAAHWTRHGDELFAPLHRTRRGRPVDVNRRSRQNLRRAIDAAGGLAAPSGKVVAELSFGFWRYLSSAAHEKTLWVPHLHRGFKPGTDRRELDGLVTQLHHLRNRVAHHEPLLRVDVVARHEDMLAVARTIDDDLASYIAATSRVRNVIDARPIARK